MPLRGSNLPVKASEIVFGTFLPKIKISPLKLILRAYPSNYETVKNIMPIRRRRRHNLELPANIQGVCRA